MYNKALTCTTPARTHDGQRTSRRALAWSGAIMQATTVESTRPSTEEALSPQSQVKYVPGSGHQIHLHANMDLNIINVYSLI